MRESYSATAYWRRRSESMEYALRVGVISEAHKAALLDRDDTFELVVTGCKR